MALTPLNFPPAPFDGQLFPATPVAGVFQYVWNAEIKAWLIVSGAVQEVLGNNPIVVTGTVSVPVVNIRPASETGPGSMSSEDYIILRNLPSQIGSVSRINTGVGLSGGPITTSGTISLLPATGGTIGGVKAGAGVTILPDGTLEAFSGVTRIETGTGIGGGPITTTGTVFLRPPAGGNIGGVKAGNNVTIDSNGVISAYGGGGGTGAFVILDDISPQFNGTATQFSLRVNGATQNVTQPANLFIVLGGVLQTTPLSFFVANTTTVVFTTPPPSGTSFSGRLFVPNGQSFQLLDDISTQFNGIRVTFPITVGGQPYNPASVASLFVSVGGIIQTPNQAYVITTNQITFSSPPPAGATFSGQVLGI
jgi:hypothetical protein